MGIATRLALLGCLAGLVAGCGSTAEVSSQAASSSAPAASSASPKPTVSQALLVQEAGTALKAGPASQHVLKAALAKQEPDASQAQISRAVHHLDIDWNSEALRFAKATVHGGTGTTKWLLGHALTSAGHFTKHQANYAVDHVPVNWHHQAVKGLQHVLNVGHGWSRPALIHHVVSVDHYTTELANFAADHVKVDWNAQAVKAARAYAPSNRRGVETTLARRGFTHLQASGAADALGFYTLAQMNAVEAAKSYLRFQGFSRQGLIEQLHSSYGSGFSLADATFAVEHIKVNWNHQAVRAAKAYLNSQPFSRQGLIEQLSSSYGSGFTIAQATYAVNHVGL